jgi:frataxin-like iron-binding protein CyaY
VDGDWQDTKGQGEFFSILTRDASDQSGASLVFRRTSA